MLQKVNTFFNLSDFISNFYIFMIYDLSNVNFLSMQVLVIHMISLVDTYSDSRLFNRFLVQFTHLLLFHVFLVVLGQVCDHIHDFNAC